jgi:methyl-accepting chemotaxis protein
VIWPFSEKPSRIRCKAATWYQDAVKAGEAVLTERYVDTTTNSLMISAAVPTKREGKLIGVTASDFSLKTLVSMITKSECHTPRV